MSDGNTAGAGVSTGRELVPVDDHEEAKRKDHLDERAQLIDAARESARTFDKAVLTFAAAVFGFSIGFLKDVAPHPVPSTMVWLGTAWGCFSTALLSILTAFLCGQQACHFEITESTKALKPGYIRRNNRWSTAAHWGNGLCVAFLFIGLACWSKFAFDNLAHADSKSQSAGRSEKPSNAKPGEKN